MSEAVHFLGAPLDSDEAYNLTVIRSEEGVLMGTKTRGYGKGKLVLPGGKEQCYISSNGVGLLPIGDGALREVHQETGLVLPKNNLRGIGSLFVTTDDDERSIRIFVAEVESEPSLAPSDELSDLQWMPEANVPYDRTPEDYKLWLPHVLAGYAINGFIETYQGDIIGGSIFRQKLEPLGRMEHLEVSATS